MISEGSRDSEDWSNGCWKFNFVLIQELKYIYNTLKLVLSND